MVSRLMMTVVSEDCDENGCARVVPVRLPRCGAVGLNVDLVQTSTFLASHLPPHHCSSRNPGRARCLWFTFSAYRRGDDLVVATDVHELTIRRSGSCCRSFVMVVQGLLWNSFVHIIMYCYFARAVKSSDCVNSCGADFLILF